MRSLCIIVLLSLAAAAARADEAADPGCPAGWIRNVYQLVKPRTVRIESAGMFGAGFVFSTPRRIATAYHVVELGRPIRVYTADGRELKAKTIGVDRDHDLAILEVDRDVGEPLVLAAPEQVGQPVLALGHPLGEFKFGKYFGVADWSVSAGILGGYSEEKMQTDAEVFPGHTGGPLVNCRGDVIGVTSKRNSGEGMTFIIPAAKLSTLAAQSPKPYIGAWRLRDPTLGTFLQGTGREWTIGAYIGLSVVAYDRLQFTLRAGYGGAFYTQLESPAVNRSLLRGFAHVLLGYRIALWGRYGLYLVPAIGVGFTMDRETLRIVELVGGTVGTRGIDSNNFWVAPVAGLSLHIFRHAEVGFYFEANTTDIIRSNNTLIAALHF